MLTMIRKCKYKEILQKVIIKDGIINIIGLPENLFWGRGRFKLSVKYP